MADLPGDLPGVSLISLNYNGKRHLRPLLDSLAALDYPKDKLEVIIADNASSDGSAEFIRAEFPWVRLIANDRNWGFGEGNNRAAREATHEYVAFLNNDMKVEPDWLRQMVKPLQEQPGLACVTSKILNWDGSAIDFIGAGVNFQGFGYQYDYGARSSPRDRAGRRLCPCGGAMLMDKAVFLEIGGFDGDYFAFYEDTDLGWRLNILGHDVWYTPDAVALHRHHGSFSKVMARKLRLLYERNSLYTMYKCLDDANLAVALPAALLLLNEKALRMAHVEESRFRLGDLPQRPTSAPPAENLQLHAFDPGAHPRGSLATRAMRVFRTQGARSFAGKAVTFARHRFDGWIWQRVQRMPLPGQLQAIPAVSVAAWLGMSDFGHNLELLQVKRRWLQERRKRTDAELMELFLFGLQPSFEETEYVRFHNWLIKVTGLSERFAAAHHPEIENPG